MRTVKLKTTDTSNGLLIPARADAEPGRGEREVVYAVHKVPDDVEIHQVVDRLSRVGMMRFEADWSELQAGALLK